jgi:regulator of protease activity HflC (stomatin/prohibitin superfamily)
MGWLIFVILFGLVSAICIFLAIAMPKMDYRRNVFITGAVCGILAIIMLIAGSIITVPYGHIAVMSRFGRITGEIKNNGLSFKSIVDTPIIMSIQTQKDEVPNASASMDLQDVSTVIAVNYRIDPLKAPEILRTMGEGYWAVFAAPAEQEIVKSITAKYNAEDMILRREEVKQAISEALAARLAERGIITEVINITNFEFSPEFTAAIEAKVVAAQEIEKSKNQLERIRVEAEQAKVKAEGEAQAAIARANGQAEANNIIAKSLTPEVLQYFMLDKLGQDIKVMVIPSGQGLTLTVPEP